MNKVTLRLFAVLVIFSLLSFGRSSPALSDQLSYVATGATHTKVAQETSPLSFSIGRTWGTTGSPYPANTSYLNYPSGLVADGNTIWIVESNGRQVSQFSSDGTFQRRIGRPGMLDYNGTALCWLTDATLDPDGHLWVVDQCAKHVVEFDVNGNVLQELGQTWTAGSGNDQFQEPMGVAIDSDGNVYVSDGTPPWNVDDGNHRIQVYDASGAYLSTIGTTGTPGSGTTTFHGPRYLFIDDADRLYVADSGNHRVQILDVTNPYVPTFVGTLGVTGQSGSDNAHLNTPTGVAVTSSSIYVADTINHRVQVYDRATLAYQATIGSYGTGDYEFENPVDVDVDDAGNVYVVDAGNLRVQAFDSGYLYQRTFGTLDVPYLTDGLHYNYPGGVAIDPNDDSVYLVEVDGQRLVKLDTSGDLVWAIGEPGVKGSDNFHFHYPRDVAVDQAGVVYVADALNHRIQVFNTSGTYSATLGSQGNGDYEFDTPSGLAISPDGLLYVADSGNRRVQVFDRGLTYLDSMSVNGYGDTHYFNWPEDVAVDTRGYVYVADAGENAIAVFTPADSGPGFDGLAWMNSGGYPTFSYLGRLATDSSDYLYVVDAGRHAVYQLHWPKYGVLEIIGEGLGDGPGYLDSPYGAAIDSHGGLWVGDRNNQRIQEFARSGPGIARTYPFSDTVDVPTHRWISAVFDDALNPSTVNGTTVRLYQADMSPVAGSVGYIPISRMAVFRPSVDLAPSSTYTVELTTGVQSVYGHALAEGTTWSFTTGDGQPPLPDDMYFYFGDLHSHSSYSDGQGVPADTFATARANGADFYALTDHAFEIDPSEWLDIGVQADLASVTGTFAALRGFEYTHNTFGHLNVLGTSDYVHRDDPNYDTGEEFYAWLAAQTDAIGQFNHPFPGDFDDFAYHAGAAQRIALTEVHRSYSQTLSTGWRVAMAPNSDTHQANWGDHPGTGVLASELTQEAILEALRARRVFNMWDEGPPMGLAMRVNGHWMGEVISATTHLNVEVMLYTPNSEGRIAYLTLYDNGLPVDSIVPLPWEPMYTWETTIPGAPGHFYYVEAGIKVGTWARRGSTAPIWTSDRMTVYLPVVMRGR